MMKSINNYDIYAVCGKPILHSKSPHIFRVLFDKLNLNATYTRIASDSPNEILSISKELGIAGLNVTAPFKSDMFKFMDECDDASKSIEAVNTIKFDYGKIKGFNTDIPGVIDTLIDNGLDLNQKISLIVGYGNAARAAAFAINSIYQNVKIYVTGRSKEKAEEFAKKFNCTPLFIDENINPTLIISTIPKTEYFNIEQYLPTCEYFMDAAYPGSLMSKESEKYNCKIIPGEEWLLNQALASFEIFTGIKINSIVQKDFKIEFKNFSQNDIKTSQNNILLTGFSGSGKSSIGKILASKLGYMYFDTDKLIEERENLIINDIFNKKGETYFRNVEREVLERICRINKAVISCGGGTLCSTDNQDIAQKSGITVWLHSTLNNCLNRIDKNNKPMLKVKSIDEIEKLYDERKIQYGKSSDLLVSNSGESSKAVENIVNELKMIKLINNS